MLRAPLGLSLLLLMVGLACAATHTSTSTTYQPQSNAQHRYENLHFQQQRLQQRLQQQQQQEHHSSSTTASSGSSDSGSLVVVYASIEDARRALAATGTSRRSSALEILNPWLSACDLQPASATDFSHNSYTCSRSNNNNPHNKNMRTTTANKPIAILHNSSDTTSSSSTMECHTVCPTGSSTPTFSNNNKRSSSSSSSSSSSRKNVGTQRSAANINSTTTNTQQCLEFLDESHKEKICSLRGLERRQRLARLRLRHCCDHVADSAVMYAPDGTFMYDSDELFGTSSGSHLATSAKPSSSARIIAEDKAACHQVVGALIEVDALAARISCEFAEVLARYDCSQRYSIKNDCEDCKEAYRKWVCSSLVPHFSPEGRRIRPCLGVCQEVEQRCPYMLPGDRAPAIPTQYAGEPTFLCLDQNIPETGEQRKKSSHGPPDCCYNHCGMPGRGSPVADDTAPTSASATDRVLRSGNLCHRCPPGPDQSPVLTDLEQAGMPEPVSCAVPVPISTSCGPRTQYVPVTQRSRRRRKYRLAGSHDPLMAAVAATLSAANAPLRDNRCRWPLVLGTASTSLLTAQLLMPTSLRLSLRRVTAVLVAVCVAVCVALWAWLCTTAAAATSARRQRQQPYPQSQPQAKRCILVEVLGLGVVAGAAGAAGATAAATRSTIASWLRRAQAQSASTQDCGHFIRVVAGKCRLHVFNNIMSTWWRWWLWRWSNCSYNRGAKMCAAPRWTLSLPVISFRCFPSDCCCHCSVSVSGCGCGVSVWCVSPLRTFQGGDRAPHLQRRSHHRHHQHYCRSFCSEGSCYRCSADAHLLAARGCAGDDADVDVDGDGDGERRWLCCCRYCCYCCCCWCFCGSTSRCVVEPTSSSLLRKKRKHRQQLQLSVDAGAAGTNKQVSPGAREQPPEQRRSKRRRRKRRRRRMAKPPSPSPGNLLRRGNTKSSSCDSAQSHRRLGL